MSEVVEEKSRGLKFAERQLLRHGWEHGKGLGRAENGISEAIKVKVKCDKGGVGHKEGEQFTFQWWDHVFNKASSSLQVESDQNGIKLKRTVEEDDDGMISNKKPRKACLAKEKLYGCFVKSSTLLCGEEQPESKPSSLHSDSSSEEEEEEGLDLSSTNKLSDSDLMKACGGRTAHKGARHGLTMNAKLARLEQQEAEFMAKYGKKSPPAGGAAPACRTSQPETMEERPEKIKKKKKRTVAIEGGGDVGEKPLKMREEEEERSEEGVVSQENGEEVKTKRNKKKSKTEAKAPSPIREQETEKVKKKKKKKKKSSKEPTEEEEKEERLKEEEEAGDSNLKQKRKKCKKERALTEDRTEEEACPTKKKKKKKSKD